MSFVLHFGEIAHLKYVHVSVLRIRWGDRVNDNILYTFTLNGQMRVCIVVSFSCLFLQSEKPSCHVVCVSVFECASYFYLIGIDSWMAQTVWNNLLNQPAFANSLKSLWLHTIYHKHCTYFHGIKSDLQVALVSSILSVFD